MTVMLTIFFGVFGIDRFYLGRRRSGLIKLFTLGGFGYWWLFDVILTVAGRQRDEQGLRLHGAEMYRRRVLLTIAVVYGTLFVLGLAFGVLAGILGR